MIRFKCFYDTHKQLDTLERVATKLEEIVVNPHFGQAQNVSPNRSQLALDIASCGASGRSSANPGNGGFGDMSPGACYTSLLRNLLGRHQACGDTTVAIEAAGVQRAGCRRFFTDKIPVGYRAVDKLGCIRCVHSEDLNSPCLLSPRRGQALQEAPCWCVFLCSLET